MPTIPEHPVTFQWHPAVWLLVAFLVVAYVYMVRVIGPKAVPAGQPVLSKLNKISFVLAIASLWIASDWPVHDIGEEYLFSFHMLQHMILGYVMAPLALMATPTWLARLLLGDGKVYRTVRWFAHPVVAGVLFNASIMILHIPQLVNISVESGPLHYTLHVMVVVTSLLMWLVVCGPIQEFRISIPATMVYLFLQSVVPTVPSGWLVFAEGVVYKVYDKPLRLWGLSAVEDQQIAGAIMKVGGGFYLWGILIYIFFAKFSARHEDSYDYRRPGKMPASEIVGNDELPLTTEDVERAFSQTSPVRDPH